MVTPSDNITLVPENMKFTILVEPFYAQYYNIINMPAPLPLCREELMQFYFVNIDQYVLSLVEI